MTTYTRQARLDHARQSGWTVVHSKKAPVIFAFKELAGKIHLKAWTGKHNAPDFYHALASMQQAEKFASELVTSEAERLALKQDRKAREKAALSALKASDHWTVGDVLSNSWGYDQTNVDWYQVTEVLGKSVMIRPIAANSSYSGQSMTGYTQPDRNHFTGPAVRKLVAIDGNVVMKHGNGHKWNGKPERYSCYA